MLCASCQAQIDTRWKHSIEKNVCPFCGEHIMDEELKQLLTVLGEVITQLQDYPNELNDWMLSNHSYIKTDSPDLHLYMPKDMAREEAGKKKPALKKKAEAAESVGSDDGSVEKLQDDSQTSTFFKRAGAGASPSEKTQHLKRMAEKIKKSGIGIMPSGDDEEGESGLDIEPVKSLDASEKSYLKSLISGNDFEDDVDEDGPYDDDEDDDIDKIPASVLAFANKGSQSSSSSAQQDLLKLKTMQSDTKKKFKSGQGAFSRS